MYSRSENKVCQPLSPPPFEGGPVFPLKIQCHLLQNTNYTLFPCQILFNTMKEKKPTVLKFRIIPPNFIT